MTRNTQKTFCVSNPHVSVPTDFKSSLGQSTYFRKTIRMCLLRKCENSSGSGNVADFANMEPFIAQTPPYPG